MNVKQVSSLEVLVARVYDYVEKKVKLVLLLLFHRQLMPVQPPKRLFGTLSVYSMYFSEFLQRWVVLTLRLIEWHATRFCVSSYMKGVDHELHSADKPVSKVCSLSIKVAQKGMQIARSVIPEIAKSFDVLTMSECHDNEQVHLSRRLTSVHFSCVDDNNTGSNKSQDPSSSVMKSMNTFFLSTTCKESMLWGKCEHTQRPVLVGEK